MSTPDGPSIDWRRQLPALSGNMVALREPAAADVAALLDVLSIADASRFGLELPLADEQVLDLVARFQRERETGTGFAFAIVAHGAVVGLFHVRQLDPGFEAAEWESTLVPSARGTGVFMEAARLVGTFVFTEIGAHRLEARALLQNGRANGALRKLGAVQEGVLRRAVLRDGEYHDQVLWSVLKDDWGGRFVSSSVRVH
jgi:RimJ/RimL family protein N-acetyltransferase